MTTTRYEVLRANELGEVERARWEALRSAVPSLESPFLSSGFTAHVGAVRPDARVGILRTDGGADIAGFLPFHVSPTRLGRPIGRRLANAQGAVVDPSTEWDPRTFVRRSGLRALTFDQLVPDQRAFAPYVSATDVAQRLDVSGGYEAYEAIAKARGLDGVREAGKKRRRLEREHDVRFEWDDRDAAAMTTLLSWKSTQYRRTGAYDQTRQAWVVELLQRLHASDDPQCSGVLSTLRVDERLVAAHFALRSGGHLASWFPAYDVAWSKHSPGSIVLRDTVQAAVAAGITTIDLGKGGEDYKKRWATGELAVRTATVHGYPGGAALATATRVAQDAVRRTPARALAQRLRWRIDVG